MMKNLNDKFIALALAILGLSLLALLWGGRIAEFVDPRLVVVLFPVGLIYVILAQVVLSSAGNEHKELNAAHTWSNTKGKEETTLPGWGLLWLLIPLIIGFLFPS